MLEWCTHWWLKHHFAQFHRAQQRHLMGYAHDAMLALTYPRVWHNKASATAENAFKAVQIMVPSKAWALDVGEEHIDQLAILPFIARDRPLLERLNAELAIYKVLIEGLLATTDLQGFWLAIAEKLPGWSEATRMVLTMAPSTAAAERVFFLMKTLLNNVQQSTLTDAIKTAIMANCNSRNLELVTTGHTADHNHAVVGHNPH